MWSNSKKIFFKCLAKSVQKRLDIHITGYGAPRSHHNREWITFDKEEIFNTIGSHEECCRRDPFKCLTDVIYTYCTLSIEEIIVSENPYIRGFGYIDKRFGKRRLKAVQLEGKSPFEIMMYKIRLIADGDTSFNILTEIEAMKTPRRIIAPKDETLSLKKLEEHNKRKTPLSFITYVLNDKISDDTEEAKHIRHNFNLANNKNALLDKLKWLSSNSKLLDSFELLESIFTILLDESSYVRELQQWKVPSYNLGKQFSSFVRHLYAKYDVPLFMDDAFYSGNLIHQSWFKALGQGNNFRKCNDLPIKLTQKITHYFLQAPDSYSILAALRYGQILSLGGDKRISDGLLETRLVRDFFDDKFCLSVLKFFIDNPMLDTAQYNPIVDYLWNQKYHDQQVFVEHGVIENIGPAQPNLSMRGRTVEALLREVDAWHIRLGIEASTADLKWHKSKTNDFEHIEGTKQSSNMKMWKINELLSANELRSEGKALKHCVASYAKSCHSGECSIWSMSLTSGQGSFEKLLTIELANQELMVRQVRGKSNRAPRQDELQIIERWCEKENLKIATYIV